MSEGNQMKCDSALHTNSLIMCTVHWYH